MEALKPLTFVRIAVVFKQFAVVEESTGEPLQFLTKSFNDPEDFRRYASKVASYWDELLGSKFEKVRL